MNRNRTVDPRFAMLHAIASRMSFHAIRHGERKSKSPMVASWRRWATTDEKRIVAFWTRNPDALPAIDLGRAGLIVIDADNHGNGQDGMGELTEILAANGHAIDSGTMGEKPARHPSVLPYAAGLPAEERPQPLSMGDRGKDCRWLYHRTGNSHAGRLGICAAWPA